jgi:hypothetical protein
VIAQTLQGALASGLALTGVLAVAGVAAARFGRTLPHLGFAALGAGAAVIAGRLATIPRVLTILALLAAAAAAGAVGWWIDRRAAATTTHVWPPALMGDVAVLVVGIGIAGLLRLPAAVELPLGVLGGVTSTVAAVVALVIGVGSAVALGLGLLDSLPEVVRWVVVTVVLAVAVAVGAGMLQVSGTPALPAFGIPDVAGIAVRAVAVGVVARRGVWWGIGAAAVLGLGEAALRSVWTAGDLVLVVYLVLIVMGLRSAPRPGIAAA